MDLKSLKTPLQALGAILSMSDAEREQAFSGLGPSERLELAGMLGKVGSLAANVADTAKLQDRVGRSLRQLRGLSATLAPTARVRTDAGTRRTVQRGTGVMRTRSRYSTFKPGLGDMGSWLSEAINGATGILTKTAPIVGTILGTAIGTNPGAMVPGYAGGVGLPNYSNASPGSWYAAQAAQNPIYAAAGATTDMGILSILARVLGTQQPGMTVPTNPYGPVFGPAIPSDGKIFGLDPIVALALAGGAFFLISQRRN